MARVRDIIEEEEWKMKPLSLLLAVSSGILGSMIIFNAVFHQPGHLHLAQGQPAGATHMDVTAPQDGAATTVTLKYDPLIEDTQRELLAVGLFKGLVDGVNGQRTRQAIAQYQQINGLPVTGEASQDLINHIRFTRKVQAAAQFTGSTEPAEGSSVALKSPADSAAPAPAPAQAAVQTTRIKKVQVALAGLGYEINTLDGQVNGETRAAILKYQMDNGLDMSGGIDDALLTALKVH
ncbi:MAG: peptidoglycan-binding protein [Alphaproteobacteria bacterium]|nr:peptidoglycan-binding protein [Alphaproteobacteria bacterium]